MAGISRRCDTALRDSSTTWAFPALSIEEWEGMLLPATGEWQLAQSMEGFRMRHPTATDGEGGEAETLSVCELRLVIRRPRIKH